MYYSANRRAVASKRFDRLGASRQTFAVNREQRGFGARQLPLHLVAIFARTRRTKDAVSPSARESRAINRRFIESHYRVKHLLTISAAFHSHFRRSFPSRARRGCGGITRGSVASLSSSRIHIRRLIATRDARLISGVSTILSGVYNDNLRRKP